MTEAIHWRRPDDMIACRLMRTYHTGPKRGHLRNKLSCTPIRNDVTCKLCQRTIAFKHGLPSLNEQETPMKGPIVAQVNATCKPSSQIRRLTFSEKTMIQDLMKPRLKKVPGAMDEKGRQYYRYETSNDNEILANLVGRIPGLNIDHIQSHRMTEFGPLCPAVLKPPVPGTLPALEKAFAEYKAYVDHELELHKKALLYLARQKGCEPHVRDILDD